jgi:tetratricopeptide (TPR) repeat protein
MDCEMRNSAIYLTLVLLCQLPCFGDDINKSLDQLLGAPQAGDSADSGSASGSAAPAEKPKNQKAQREKKPKADASAGSAGDVPKVDPAQIDKSLDKLLGGTPAPSSSLPSAPTPPADSASPPAAADDGVGSTDEPAAGAMQPSAAPSNAATAPAAPEADSSDAMTSTGNAGDSADDKQYNYSDNQIKAGELNNDAVTALNAKQFQKAVDMLKQALTLWPGYRQGKSNLRVAYFNWGVELYNSGKYAQAMPYLEKAMQLAKELGIKDSELQATYDDCKSALAEESKKK